jgi:hypothetical protein
MTAIVRATAGAAPPPHPLRQHLEHRQQRLLDRLGRAARLRARSAMSRAHRDLCEVTECLRLLEAPAPPRYAVSALFLVECFHELTKDEDEQLFFVTGPESGGVLVPCVRVAFAHEHRSAVGVTGDTADSHRALINLEVAGHRLLAHCHSHPSQGLSSTTPSGTDQGFQRRLEGAGYPAVGAIFSRDGFVRFFRSNADFTVEVFGAGVERHGPHAVRLPFAGAAR